MTTAKKKSSTRKPQAKAQPKVRPATAAAQSWAQQSAKLYPFAAGAGDATKAAEQAAKQVQSATEQWLKYGSDFMNQMLSAAPELSAAQAKVKQSVPGLSLSADTASKSLNEFAELGRENGEALVESSNIAIAAGKQFGAEVGSYINRAFSNNVDLSKQVLSCRTLNDIFDLNNKFVKSNLDAFFNESVKLSELFFQAASDVSEPLNERITETTERLTKTFAA